MQIAKQKNWIKSIGLGAFLFFLIKGILWLIVGYLIIK